jgi:hypothetical protein
VKQALAQPQPAGAPRSAAEPRQRNLWLLILLLGVVGGLLVGSILFVAFRG